MASGSQCIIRKTVAVCLCLFLTACIPADFKNIDGTATGQNPAQTSAQSEFSRDADVSAAIAYAEHYVAALSLASTSGDTAYLRSLGSPDCVNCEIYPELYEAVYQDGGYFVREPWKVISSEVNEVADGFEILTTISAPPTRWRMHRDEPEKTKGVEIYRVGFVVATKPELKIIDMFSLE